MWLFSHGKVVFTVGLKRCAVQKTIDYVRLECEVTTVRLSTDSDDKCSLVYAVILNLIAKHRIKIQCGTEIWE